MKHLTLVLAILFAVPFLLTLSWWSNYGFGRNGTLAYTAYGIFLILGAPTGLASVLLFWRWSRL